MILTNDQMIKNVTDLYGEKSQMTKDFCFMIEAKVNPILVAEAYEALMAQDYDYEECNDEVGFNPYLGCYDNDC